MYSELAVHRKQNPNANFDPENYPKELLEDIYPINMVDPMSERLDTAFKSKLIGRDLAKLDMLPSYKDKAADEWRKEKMEYAMKKKRDELRVEDVQKAKIFKTAILNKRAQQLKEQKQSKYIYIYFKDGVVWCLFSGQRLRATATASTSKSTTTTTTTAAATKKVADQSKQGK